MPAIGLIECSLRHGQQTLLLSRLRTRHLLPVLERLEGSGIEAVDVFGGATYQSGLEHLGEDPLERLRTIRAHTRLPLLGLVRGQALVGFRPVADDAVDRFVTVTAEAGLDRFRCFDPLNDPRNLARVVQAVLGQGRVAEAAIVYTESPAHSIAGFIALGQQLASLGFTGLCLFDPAGLLGAGQARQLVSGLIETAGLPVSVHCATITGQASFAYLTAAEAGAAALDVCLSPLAGGASLPATEGVLAALRGTDFQPTVDEAAVLAAADALDEAMPLYRPIADPSGWQHDSGTLRTQLAPSVLEHLRTECEAQGAADKMGAVLEELPRVRAAMGSPALITPVAEIVVTQAVANVASGEPYLTVSQDAKDYFLGLFGAPPGPVDPEVRKLVIGSETPITVGPADVLDPALPAADRAVRRHHWDEAGGVTALHYLLFPGPTRRLLEGEAHVERLEDEATPEPEAEPEAVIPDGGDLSEAIGDAAAVPLGPPPPPAPVPAAEPEVAWREFTVEVEGEVYEVRVGARDGGGLGSLATAAPASGPAPSAQGGVKAPMQGLIAKVVVKPGDQVAVGQTVVVLEAMKMQNDIPSDRAGVVGSVLVAEGQVVSRGEVLVTVG